MDPLLSDIESIKRMAVAMAIGAVLGFERERANKPAGMRTYMLVVQGAALFMICGILLSNQMAAANRISDPGRIASTVIQGIGFIAAGVIINSGREVFGLTTAAGIWVAAALGLLAGAGFFTIAIAATGATVVALLVLQEVESRLMGTKPKSSNALQE